MLYSIVFLFLTGHLMFNAALGDLTRGLSDVSAVRGSTVTLHCSTNLSLPVMWKFRKANSRSIELWDLIYLAHPTSEVEERYRNKNKYNVTVDSTGNEYNLIIYNLQTDDAGTYRCIDGKVFDGNNHEEEHSGYYYEANVIVIGVLVKPENTAAVKGETVKLRCEGDTSQSSKIVWQRQQGTSLSTICQCNGTQPVDYKCINNNERSCDLLMENVNENYAGDYLCSLSSNVAEIFHAFVIILSASPQCTTVPSDRVDVNDSVHMSCGVTYAGSLAPLMTWVNADDEVLVSINQSTIISAVYEVNVAAEIPSVQSHTCKTNFTRAPPPGPGTGSYATNIPSYKSFCNTSSITVQYPPYSQNMKLKSNSYLLGSLLACSVTAEPADISYNWTDDRGIVFGNNHTITLNTIGQDLNFTCFACNRLGCSSTRISLSVIEGPGPGIIAHYMPMVIGLSVGLGVSGGINLVALFCCCKSFCKNKDDKYREK